VAISTSILTSARSRSQRFLLPIGLSLIVLTGCSQPTADNPTVNENPPPITTSASQAPAAEEEAPVEVLLRSKLLVESALNYTACPTCSDLGFLMSAEILTTHAELERLERSQRAQLPWPAMQARSERSRITVIDVEAQPSGARAWSVVVSATRTIRTTSARSRSFVQVHLIVIRQRHRWLVDQARGAGL